MYQDLIRNELNEAAETLANFIKDDANIHAIQRAAVLLADSFKAGGKVLSCGNGGSHCDAMHFAEELTGRYRENRPGYPAIAISDVSHISCVSNDFGYDYVFSRYVEAVGREGDVLLGISTSGNSGNVIKAIAAAREKGMKHRCINIWDLKYWKRTRCRRHYARSERKKRRMASRLNRVVPCA